MKDKSIICIKLVLLFSIIIGVRLGVEVGIISYTARTIISWWQDIFNYDIYLQVYLQAIMTVIFPKPDDTYFLKDSMYVSVFAKCQR